MKPLKHRTILLCALWLLSTFPAAAWAGDAPVTIVLLGDGYLNGWGMNQADTFKAQLPLALARDLPNVTVTSPGYLESTASGMTWLNDRDEGKALLADPVHHAVILALGVLDCAHVKGPQLPLDKTKANLGAILDTLAAHGIPVLLVGAKAFPDCGNDYYESFNQMYPGIAAQHGVPVYPDFMQALYGHPELLDDDKFGPNPAGVKVVVQDMLPMVKDLAAAAGN